MGRKRRRNGRGKISDVVGTTSEASGVESSDGTDSVGGSGHMVVNVDASAGKAEVVVGSVDDEPAVDASSVDVSVEDVTEACEGVVVASEGGSSDVSQDDGIDEDDVESLSEAVDGGVGTSSDEATDVVVEDGSDDDAASDADGQSVTEAVVCEDVDVEFDVETVVGAGDVADVVVDVDSADEGGVDAVVGDSGEGDMDVFVTACDEVVVEGRTDADSDSDDFVDGGVSEAPVDADEDVAESSGDVISDGSCGDDSVEVEPGAECDDEPESAIPLDSSPEDDAASSDVGVSDGAAACVADSEVVSGDVVEGSAEVDSDDGEGVVRPSVADDAAVASEDVESVSEDVGSVVASAGVASASEVEASEVRDDVRSEPEVERGHARVDGGDADVSDGTVGPAHMASSSDAPSGGGGKPRKMVSFGLCIALAIGTCGIGGLLGYAYGNSSRVQSVSVTSVDDSHLGDAICHVSWRGHEEDLSVEDVLVANGAMLTSQGAVSHEVPSTEAIVAVARSRVLAMAADEAGISVTDDDVRQYITDTLSVPDLATASETYGLSESDFIRLAKDSVIIDKLREHVLEGQGASEAEPPVAPEPPKQGEEGKPTREYYDYVRKLVGDDGMSSTGEVTKSPYAEALKPYAVSADGGATFEAAQAAYDVALREYAESMPTDDVWSAYRKDLLKDAAIEVRTLTW